MTLLSCEQIDRQVSSKSEFRDQTLGEEEQAGEPIMAGEQAGEQAHNNGGEQAGEQAGEPITVVNMQENKPVSP